MLRMVKSTGAALAVCGLFASGAAAANANTIYVAPGGSDANSCTSSAHPCKTITKALEDAEAGSGAPTVRLAAGIYNGDIHILSAQLANVKIIGAGATTSLIVDEPLGGAPTVTTQVNVTLERLGVLNEAPNEYPAIEHADGRLTLNKVDVVGEDLGSTPAIETSAGAIDTSLTIRGGRIRGVSPSGNALNVAGNVLLEDESVETLGENASAIQCSPCNLLARNTNFIARAHGSLALNLMNSAAHLIGGRVENAATGAVGVQAFATQFRAEGTRFVDTAPGGGVTVLEGPASTVRLSRASLENTTLNSPSIVSEYGALLELDRTTVRQSNPGNTVPVLEAITSGPLRLRASRLTARGIAVLSEGAARVEVVDSRLTSTGSGGGATVYLIRGPAAELGLVVRRSVVKAPLGAAAPIMTNLFGGVVIDSSELIGGSAGLMVNDFEGPKEARVAVIGSTIDGYGPGVLDAGHYAIETIDSANHARINMSVVGSVLFEPIRTAVEVPSAHVTLHCAYSDLPGTKQNGPTSVSCGAGRFGNKKFISAGSVFAPPFTAYTPRAGSNAIDSVPISALALPYGQRHSATDVNGRRRSNRARFAGRCVAVQDRGAQQRAGQKGSC